MVRNFFLNGEKNERVKIIKKKGQQFIVLQAVVEKKESTFFWDKLYMENYVILPDKARELKLIDISDFEKIDYDKFYPTKVNIIDYDKVDIGEIIYATHKNYVDREIVRKNFAVFAEIINDWDKELETKIKEIKEIIIEDNDDNSEVED